MRVGFVGLGTMGLPMAQRLLAASHEVTGFSRSDGPLQRLVKAGGVPASDLQETISSSAVLIMCLPDDVAVMQVVQECLPLVAGKVLIDCSTVSPETERRLHREVVASGGRYLDAPVSGGPVGARAGTLSTVVGGDGRTLAAVRPLIGTFAAHIVLVGGPGSGQVVKLCNQVVVGAQMLGLCEAIRLAVRSGVEPSQVHEMLLHSTGDCFMARTRFPVPGVLPDSPASNNWRPDFTTHLMAKDLDLALTQADSVRAALPVAAALHAALELAMSEGLASRDWSSVSTVLARGQETA